jgi:hypothetical protein
MPDRAVHIQTATRSGAQDPAKVVEHKAGGKVSFSEVPYRSLGALMQAVRVEPQAKALAEALEAHSAAKKAKQVEALAHAARLKKMAETGANAEGE